MRTVRMTAIIVALGMLLAGITGCGPKKAPDSSKLPPPPETPATTEVTPPADATTAPAAEADPAAPAEAPPSEPAPTTPDGQ